MAITGRQLQNVAADSSPTSRSASSPRGCPGRAPRLKNARATRARSGAATGKRHAISRTLHVDQHPEVRRTLAIAREAGKTVVTVKPSYYRPPPLGATARPVCGEIMPGHRLWLASTWAIWGIAVRVLAGHSCMRMI